MEARNRFIGVRRDWLPGTMGDQKKVAGRSLSIWGGDLERSPKVISQIKWSDHGARSPSPLNGERAGVRGENVVVRNSLPNVSGRTTPHPQSLSPLKRE